MTTAFDSLPTASDSVSAASDSVPAASDSVPAASGSVSAASGSVPAASDSVPAASGSVSAASGSVSAASGSVSAASGSVSAASLHPFPLSAECISTADGSPEQSFPMRGDLFETVAVSFGFYSASRHCIPRLSPRNSHPNAITANNGAAANRRGAAPADPPRGSPPVAELESLGYCRKTYPKNTPGRPTGRTIRFNPPGRPATI